jgi:hypothetical protein
MNAKEKQAVENARNGQPNDRQKVNPQPPQTGGSGIDDTIMSLSLDMKQTIKKVVVHNAIAMAMQDFAAGDYGQITPETFAHFAGGVLSPLEAQHQALLEGRTLEIKALPSMSESTEYRTGNHSKGNAVVHLVWIPKRRKRVLMGEVAKRLRQIINATNGLQKGKVPVLVGNRNEVIWTRPEWVSSLETKTENNRVSPLSSEEAPQSPLSTDTEKRILGFLMTRIVPVLDGEIAIALELPMYQTSMALKRLEQDGLVTKNDDDGYQLPSFEVGCYISDGLRTGLINSQAKGIFTVTFGDDKFECTIEDLRENFTVCGKQLELLDSSRESADSAEHLNSSAGLNGSSQSTTTQMPATFSAITSATESLRQTSEATTPLQEQPTSTPSASPVTIQVLPANAPESLEVNQDSGSKHSVALLRDYLNSLLLSNQKESFIEACEQSLADSEWQDTVGKIRSSYRQLVSEQRSAAPDFLQLPTLTAGDGTENSRPAGIVKCDRIARKLGLMFDSQYLSVPFMAAISGFPTNWTACLLELNPKNQEESKTDSSTGEPSSPSKLRSHYSESSTFIPLLQPEKQWLKPEWITLKSGTQSRDVDGLYEANPATVQQYAELMQEGLWDWMRHPLPVAFLASDGKIYAGDCHHRVSAARAASQEIFVDLRPGELVDAVLYSCRANTDHGLPLRAKDQRKRIELFLDTLKNLDEVRSQSLLQSIPNLSEIERRNSKWSTRVIAKYLKLTESSYRTVINILQEREMAQNFTQFAVDDWHEGLSDCCAYGADFFDPCPTAVEVEENLALLELELDN